MLPWFLLAPTLVAQPDLEDAAPLTARFALTGRVVNTSFDVTSAFTERFRKRLNGGITSTVEVTIDLIDRQRNRITTARRQCTFRLDIWDDVLEVRIEDADQTVRRRFLVVDDGLKACGMVNQVPIADRALLTRPDGYRVIVTVALNPVSQEMIERSRKFSSNPRGAGGRPRSLLGGFAELFHSNSDIGGETFVFRSQMLSKPEGKKN